MLYFIETFVCVVPLLFQSLDLGFILRYLWFSLYYLFLPLLFVSPGLITVAAFNILLAYKHKLPTEKSLGYSVFLLRVRLVELCLKAMSYHSAFCQCFQISPFEGCSLLINSSSNSPGHEH